MATGGRPCPMAGTAGYASQGASPRSVRYFHLREDPRLPEVPTRHLIAPVQALALPLKHHPPRENLQAFVALTAWPFSTPRANF